MTGWRSIWRASWREGLGEIAPEPPIERIELVLWLVMFGLGVALGAWLF